MELRNLQGTVHTFEDADSHMMATKSIASQVDNITGYIKEHLRGDIVNELRSHSLELSGESLEAALGELSLLKVAFERELRNSDVVIESLRDDIEALNSRDRNATAMSITINEEQSVQLDEIAKDNAASLETVQGISDDILEKIAVIEKDNEMTRMRSENAVKEIHNHYEDHEILIRSVDKTQRELTWVFDNITAHVPSLEGKAVNIADMKKALSTTLTMLEENGYGRG